MTRSISSSVPVFVGVDGGGSSVVVRAVAGEEIVFAACGGPANAISTPPDVLERHLDKALEGCPEPVRVGACFAGITNRQARAVVAGYFARRFPAAEVRLAPDYVAALLAGADRFDVYCIAGTGSVCCSLADGVVSVSGGNGYLIGDRGSAYRYGQALVAHALEWPEGDVPARAARALTDVFGTLDRCEIVRAIHRSPAPAPLLARLAPALTHSADVGEAWAVNLVEHEVAAFARTVSGHVRRERAELEQVRIGLSGGVWTSVSVREAFASALRRQLPPKTVEVQRLEVPSVMGALALAQLPRDKVAGLAW